MRAINATVMRQVNKKLLLNQIRLRPISRAELADETGLTRASVTQIIDELISEGMVIETSIIGRTRLGRRSTQLAINPRAGVLFAVNLNRTQCTVGVTDMLGATLHQTTELVSGRTPGEILDAIAAIIAQQRREPDLENMPVLGLGMCAPGPLNAETGTLLNAVRFDMWHNLPVAQLLSQRTGLKVHLESAANAQALEQKYFARAGENFALLHIDDTMSAGIVVRDGLYRGMPDFPAELGQCPARPEDGTNLSKILVGCSRANWRGMIADPDNRTQLLQLAYTLGGVMFVYQMRHAILGGEAGASVAPILPQLTDCVRSVMPESLRNEIRIDIAASDPVRAAVSVVYNSIFSIE